MKTIQTYAMAVVFSIGIATSAAMAQGESPAMPKGQTQGMMGGDMQGMMGMMQAMGPMMEACTEMMQQMAHHRPDHLDGTSPPAGQEATPAPHGR